MYHTLNCRGTLLSLERPAIMGIVNVTPDSFSDGGKFLDPEKAVLHGLALLDQGTDILDIGGASSRPGAAMVSVEAELERVLPVVQELRKLRPEAILSIDTWRARVASDCLEAGAHIINDISAGTLEPEILNVVAGANAPYILMHMQGIPADMQLHPHYQHVTHDILNFFKCRIDAAREAGVWQIILDPGFGFGKTLSHNLQLLREGDRFSIFGLPWLAGISRKRMIRSLAGEVESDMPEIQAALHFQLMMKGASMLRVHDVEIAVKLRNIFAGIIHGTV